MPHSDYSRLFGRMKEKGFTQKSLARAIGVNYCHFGRKLKGEFPFTQREIFDICVTLDIDPMSIGEYFFSTKS